MKIHESQAKTFIEKYGIPAPKSIVVTTSEKAEESAKKLGGKVVVKAQVHTGVRGETCCVKAACNPGEAYALAKNIFGMNYVAGNIYDC